MTSRPNPVEAPAHVHALLDRLHRLSEEREATIQKGHDKFATIEKLPDNEKAVYERPDFDQMMMDQLIALDQDKSQYIYQLIRATGGTNIVEAGTGWGVSTIYLALAASQNSLAAGTKGTVIATEKEPEKAGKARENWDQCGPKVTGIIDLRVGDLLETLKSNVPQIDLLLLDIWSPLALPTLKLIQPRFRRGSVVIIDNTISSAKGYKDLLNYMRAEGSGYRNITLPFTSGLEMSVFSP